MEFLSSDVLLRRNSVLAFVITVLIGYIQWLGSGIPSLISIRSLFLLSLGLIYLSLVIGIIYHQGLKTKLFMRGYFFIEIIIALIIIFLSEGTTWLFIFPLASQVVIMLPRRDGWLVNTIFFALCLLLMVFLEKRFNWSLAFGLFCSMVFVILFSQIVLSEANNRNKVESLYKELSQANHKLQGYMVQVEELATVQERNRLARDIHDGLGHYLTALTMQIKAARAVLDNDRQRALEALKKAQSLAEGALTMYAIQ